MGGRNKNRKIKDPASSCDENMLSTAPINMNKLNKDVSDDNQEMSGEL